MASNDMDVGIEGYLYEPEKADYPNINQSGSDSELSSDTDGETVHNFRDGRTKMSAETWCQCGQCVKQKTDDECYCCKEHELITEKMDGIECFTNKTDIDQYVAHRPSLEMAFIDAMIKKHVHGPAPEQLTNKLVRGGGSLPHC
jgi:hypothetical protein